MRTATFVAIVAAFVAALSLAAPAAVDAQTPTRTATVVSIGEVTIANSGFTVGGTYYTGWCSHASSHPASCSFDSGGISQTAGTVGVGCTGSGESIASASWNSTEYSWPNVDKLRYRFKRDVLYSDSACTTELAAVTYTYPTFPTWRVRDITESSATIYIEEPFAQHRIGSWYYIPLTPSVPRIFDDSGCSVTVNVPLGETPVEVVTDLSAGTTYTYKIVDPNYLPCPQESGVLAEVTFTTSGDPLDAPTGPPPPEPPKGEDGGEPTTAVSGGSVTISWANPGDSDIASYEYSIRRAGGAAGEWRTVPGSNADTTSVTIDLASGEARAVNNATPPMVEWTIHLRARDVNGNAGGIFTATVDAAAAGGETVPAVPLVGLAMLALFLFGAAGRRLRGTAAGRR